MANIIFWSSFNVRHSSIRPFATYQLASWLRQHGYSVKVLDFCHLMRTSDLVELTKKHIGPDTIAVGVTSNFWVDIKDYDLATEPDWVVNARAMLEASTRKLFWLLGGSRSVSDNLKLPWVTFQGYCEDTLLTWLDQNSSRYVRRTPFDIATSSASYYKEDRIQPWEVLPMELGRGCQFSCRFCSYPLIGKRKGTYIKDYDKIREEFIRNYNEYGVTKYFFLDDTVNESEEKLVALAEIVQGLPFEISWTGYCRLDLIGVKRNTVQLLKDGGMRSTLFGIESFQREASSAIGKAWNGKHAKDFLLELPELWGPTVNWTLNFIAGLPGDTPQNIEDTASWCIDNKMPNATIHALGINRSANKVWKSEFDREYSKYGYTFPDDHSLDWNNNIWSRPEAKNLVTRLNAELYVNAKMATFLLFELSQFDNSISELQQLTRKDISWESCVAQTQERVNTYVSNQLSDL